MKPPHTWRTRKDPLEGVCCKVLGWLEEDPDATAVVLLERLQKLIRTVFNRAHLRTLEIDHIDRLVVRLTILDRIRGIPLWP